MILTEEEIKEMETVLKTIEDYIASGMEVITAIGMIKKVREVIVSHRALVKANRILNKALEELK